MHELLTEYSFKEPEQLRQELAPAAIPKVIIITLYYIQLTKYKFDRRNRTN